MADATTLYATCAAAAGALVAIMGGFLISRVVGLLSQRETLQMRHRELSGRVDVATTELELIADERFSVTTEWFDRDRLKLIVVARGDIDIDEFTDEYIYRGSNREEMRGLVQDRVQQVKAAFDAIESEVPEGPIPEDIFQIGNDPNSGHLPVPVGQEDVWNRVASELIQQRRPKSPYDISSSIAAIGIAATPNIVYERQDQRIRDEREKRAEVTALRAEISLIDDEMQRLGSGVPRLMTSIGLLAYFAVGSVALPVVLLALPRTPDSGIARWGVTGAFGSGLALLVIFLFSTAWSLRFRSGQ